MLEAIYSVVGIIVGILLASVAVLKVAQRAKARRETQQAKAQAEAAREAERQRRIAELMSRMTINSPPGVEADIFMVGGEHTKVPEGRQARLVLFPASENFTAVELRLCVPPVTDAEERAARTKGYDQGGRPWRWAAIDVLHSNGKRIVACGIDSGGRWHWYHWGQDGSLDQSETDMGPDEGYPPDEWHTIRLDKHRDKCTLVVVSGGQEKTIEDQLPAWPVAANLCVLVSSLHVQPKGWFAITEVVPTLPDESGAAR